MFRLLRARHTLQTSTRWAIIRRNRCSAAPVELESDRRHVESEPARPSSWSPPTGVPAPPSATPDPSVVPFRVARTKQQNLPVYLDYRNSKNRLITHVRKIDGDVLAMERMLRDHLNEKELLTRVDEVCGYIKIHGNYRDRVKSWLKSLGF